VAGTARRGKTAEPRKRPTAQRDRITNTCGTSAGENSERVANSERVSTDASSRLPVLLKTLKGTTSAWRPCVALFLRSTLAFSTGFLCVPSLPAWRFLRRFSHYPAIAQSACCRRSCLHGNQMQVSRPQRPHLTRHAALVTWGGTSYPLTNSSLPPRRLGAVKELLTRMGLCGPNEYNAHSNLWRTARWPECAGALLAEM